MSNEEFNAMVSFTITEGENSNNIIKGGTKRK